MIKNIALLYGGTSSEREVSIKSANAFRGALKKLGYNVIDIDTAKPFIEILQNSAVDVAFNALHGTFGEDGTIQGVLEYLQIPYTHSGIAASAIAMDKRRTKEVLSLHGVVSPKAVYMKAAQLINSKSDPMPRPYVVKPIDQGSTVGVYIIHENGPSFAEQLQGEWKFGDELMIEEYIPGLELSSVVIEGKGIGTLELKPKRGFYDYEAKYTEGLVEHIYPANIPQEIYKKSMEYAQIAHNVLGCRTLSRSDLRYNSQTNELYFLEINTQPGCTELSIVPEVALANGYTFVQLVEMLIRDAKCDK